MTLAEKMIEFRAKKNLSQSKLAKMTGLSLLTICHIENGYQPRPTTIVKIKQVIEKGE